MSRNPDRLELEDLPEEEGVSKADVAERIDKDPEEQKNLTDADEPDER